MGIDLNKLSQGWIDAGRPDPLGRLGAGKLRGLMRLRPWTALR